VTLFLLAEDGQSVWSKSRSGNSHHLDELRETFQTYDR
jgi:hypothetical protein